MNVFLESDFETSNNESYRKEVFNIHGRNVNEFIVIMMKWLNLYYNNYLYYTTTFYI